MLQIMHETVKPEARINDHNQNENIKTFSLCKTQTFIPGITVPKVSYIHYLLS